MKKILLIFIILFINMTYINSLEINSNNAILYNLNDNNILYEKNSEERVSVASLTKIVTAITIIDNQQDLNKLVTINYNMLSDLDGFSKAGLKIGDKVTYLDLLYALMLPSGADAAKALAIGESGSIENFSNLMNTELKKIGVNSSHFDNPIGMDSDNNYSTAYDLAQILMYSLQNETFKTIFETNTYTIESIGLKLEKTLKKTGENYNLNIEIIKGAKTGFTYDAGLCLASTAEIENVNYLLVTTNSKIDYPYHVKDALDIYNYYSLNYGYINILSKNQLLNTIHVKNSKIKTYDIVSKEDINLYLEKSITKDKLNYIYEGIDVLTKSIKNGDKIGIIKILYNERELYRYDVYLDIDIKYYNYPLYIGIGIGICIFIIISIIFISKTLKSKKQK